MTVQSITGKIERVKAQAIFDSDTYESWREALSGSRWPSIKCSKTRRSAA